MNLPAYIRQGQTSSYAQRALSNIGSGAGPYLSIEGNRFTLVDAAGNKQPVQTLHVDVVIIDVNDHMSKMFYASEWDPNNPAPPACFSDNGVAPSMSASSPQSETCAACPKNVWGSKISKMGSKIKACRDEQKTAIIIPDMPNNMFRLVVPPNSLTNFRAYVAKFLNAGFDIPDVVTRLTFEPGVQGTIEFNPAPNPWLDEATVAIRDQAMASKGSDMLVGRLDRPRMGALPAPETRALPPAQPAGAPAATPASAPPQATHPSQASATTASPSEAAPGRRKRRTAAEMEAAKQAPPAAPAMAPFRPSEASGAAFGVQPGVAPNPELQAAVKSIFGG